MDNTLPKILIGTPVYSNKRYITPYWIEAVKKVKYNNYDIFVVDNSKPSEKFDEIFKNHEIQTFKSKPHKNPFRRLAEARQKLNEYAINNNYDYLMSIEQDIIVPDNIINFLLSHKVKVAGAPYIVATHTDKNRRLIDYVVSASKLNKVIDNIDGIDINEWYLSQEIQGKGLIQVKSCSLGCTLISSEVLKKIKVRYNPNIHRADDSYFFQDCYDQNIPVFVDSTLLWKIDHIKRLGGEVPAGKSINQLAE